MAVETCSPCDGTGRVDYSGEPKACPYCHGRGVREREASP